MRAEVDGFAFRDCRPHVRRGEQWQFVRNAIAQAPKRTEGPETRIPSTEAGRPVVAPYHATARRRRYIVTTSAKPM